ncbi:MAG: hypothetical protein QOG78_2432, partial [Rhodospirillaceae bacterium]|nr:hypothetical protein [Rhodospirillaceae bacterium]
MSIVAPSEDSARLRLRRALQRAPLFADLDAASMAAIERELSLLVLPGGAPLFRQGEPADAVYVVASGCLGVFRHEDEDSAEEPILMAEIPPGNIVGEMSLLSHSQRTRSVAALRDSEVWRLARSSFDTLTSLHPEVLPALMRNVAMRNAMGPTKRRRQPRTFALLPSGPDVPSARFAVLLAGALGRIGAQVQMLGPESLNEEPEWFARCEMESSFVLYRADPTATEWTELCLRQADCLIVVRRGDDDRPTMVPFEVESAQTGAVFHRRRELVLLHEGHDPASGSTSPMLAGGLYGQHHHVRLDIHSDVDRLARLLTGHAVGVVMAGGGARAFTHIGVVKALRSSGVPIDLVGGTSMGAIVAAGVAARWSAMPLERPPASTATKPMTTATTFDLTPARTAVGHDSGCSAAQVGGHGEARGPPQRGEDQHGVADRQALGRLAVSAAELMQVARHRDREGEDRDHGPVDPEPAPRVPERPQRVHRHRRHGEHGAGDAQQR